MNTLPELPGEICVAETAAGLSVRLPWRRPARCLVTRVVLKVVLFGVALLLGAAVVAWNVPGPHASTFAVAAGVMGVTLLAIGLCLLATHSSAEVTRRELILTEWIGPVPLRRVRPFDRLRRIGTHYALEGDGADPPPNGVLEIACEGAQTLWFAVGYPREWLVALGARLAARCGVPHVEVPLDSPAVKVIPFFMEPIRDADTFDQPEQPAASGVLADHHADGLTVLRVPPGRLGKGWSGLVLFLHVMVVLPAAGLCAPVLPWPFWLAVPAGLVAASAFLCAYHFRNRWTILAASPDGLDILTTGGLLSTREQHVPRAKIRELRVGPASVGERGVPTSELWIYLTDGREIHLLPGRDEAELSWLATELRKALDVPAVAATVLTPEQVTGGDW